MNILIYAGVFIFTIIEETLRTLRIIVVSNGKKKLGAVLQFIIALIWIIVTGTVIHNIQNDPLKVVFYALGSLIGSYFGSTIEEKIALGSGVFMVEVDSRVSENLILKLRENKFKINSVRASTDGKEFLMITSPRKKTNNVIDIIRSFDEKAFILSEKVKIVPPRR